MITSALKIFCIGLVVTATVWVDQARGGVYEASVGFSFTRDQEPGEYSKWSRRWSASFGYFFTEASEVQVRYESAVTRSQVQTEQDGQTLNQDIRFDDSIISLNWVQSIFDKKSKFQPYFTLGLGQLNRDISGSYGGFAIPLIQIDRVTGVVAVGFKAFFLENFALKTEAVTYLLGGELSTWQNNVVISTGLSVYF